MEYYFSGYCRKSDQPRLVEADTEEDGILRADCDYPDCPYCRECTVAQQIREVANGREL